MGDVTISRGDLIRELDARGELVDGVAPTGAAAAFLTEEVQKQLVGDAAARQGVDATVGSIDQLQSLFQDIVADEIEQRVPDIRSVAESLTTCSRHILVTTEDEADEVLAELEGGADFAALAQVLSIDTGSGAAGGDLGCVPAGQFVPEFELALFEAAAGEVVGPVQSQFGFHVIEKLPNVADATAIIDAGFDSAFDSEDAYDIWFEETFIAPDIEVDPRYGEWDPEAFLVVPPVG